jgi:energy-coupling factor transporter ATP-binding protein EcfA2
MELDFLKVYISRGRSTVITADFQVCPSKHLLTRAKEFYAIWDEENSIWSTDEARAVAIIDKYIYERAEKLMADAGERYPVMTMRSFKAGLYKDWLAYTSQIPSRSDIMLDSTVTFADETTTIEDYKSKRLPYNLSYSTPKAYDEIISTLYAPDQRQILEWALGAVLSGQMCYVQKFVVLYGPPGSGKGTFLTIVGEILKGYIATFKAEELAKSGGFASAPFRDNPLAAIDYDGDLSGVEDNTKINAIVAHEPTRLNEKHSREITASLNTLLLVGVNNPIHITDIYSGLTRRLLVVYPSGDKVPKARYNKLMRAMLFELGAIANHCISVYNSLGPAAYDDYKPVDMMHKTDIIINFLSERFDLISSQSLITVKTLYAAYVAYCEESNIKRIMPQYKFREAIRPFFDLYYPRLYRDGVQYYSVFEGLKKEMIGIIVQDSYTDPVPEKTTDGMDIPGWLRLHAGEDLLKERLKDCPTQYANSHGVPSTAWALCGTTLADIDTDKLHYVNIQNPQHIVIDLDLRDEAGEKNLLLNLSRAKLFPETYCEVSKSGKGVHLHYIYDGDTAMLCSEVSPGIEIKRFSGGSSLRRLHTLSNNLELTTISANLPTKGAKPMEKQALKDEKHLRACIEKALRREIWPNTTPSVQYIKRVLEDARDQGMVYDVSDLKIRVISFAMKSTNNSKTLVAIVLGLPFTSGEPDNEGPIEGSLCVDGISDRDVQLTFYDVEVFPNLFMFGYLKCPPLSKLFSMTREEIYALEDQIVFRWNPSPEDVRQFIFADEYGNEPFLFGGHNVRAYDNHIMMAASMGETPEGLFQRSRVLCDNKASDVEKKAAQHRQAWNLSWFDTLELCKSLGFQKGRMERRGLKHRQIKYGIRHIENPHPWDEPLAEEYWDELRIYNANDIISNVIDFVENLRGSWFSKCFTSYDMNKRLGNPPSISPWLTDRQVYESCLFGREQNPSRFFPKVDLRKWFPEYELKPNGEAIYHSKILGDVKLGKGGLVIAEQGLHMNVLEADLFSAHPHGIKEMNVFGPYTPIANGYLEANGAMKRKDFRRAFEALGMTMEDLSNVCEFAFGRPPTDEELPSLLGEPCDTPYPYINPKGVRQCIKEFCNQGYGIFAATFSTRARNPHDNGNPVANFSACTVVRGVEAAIEAGGSVKHVKTDSLKMPAVTRQVLDAVFASAEKVGQKFEVEDIYQKFLLLNKSEYAAFAQSDKQWHFRGKKFLRPYIRKCLFTGEPMVFDDYCETISSQGTLYLVNPDNPSDSEHIGKVGRFIPMPNAASGGRTLVTERVLANGNKVLEEADDVSNNDECPDGEPAFAYSAPSGTKGWLWVEKEAYILAYGEDLTHIDHSYYEHMQKAVIDEINAITPFDELTDMDDVPFDAPCRVKPYSPDVCVTCPQNENGTCLWGYDPCLPLTREEKYDQ